MCNTKAVHFLYPSTKLSLAIGYRQKTQQKGKEQGVFPEMTHPGDLHVMGRRILFSNVDQNLPSQLHRKLPLPFQSDRIAQDKG